MAFENQSKWLYMRPLSSGLIVTGLLLLLSIAVIWLGFDHFKKGEERELENVLGKVNQKLHEFLNMSYNATLAITHTIDSTGVPINFNTSAKVALSRYKFIHFITLIQRDTIRQIYPMEGNEGIVGQNILAGERIKYEVNKASQQRGIYFVGPLRLSSGLILAGILPINSQSGFWGYSAVMVNFEDFIEYINLSELEKRGYSFQFSKIDPIKKEREYFLAEGPTKIPTTKLNVHIVEGEWDLEISKPYTLYALSGVILLGIFSLGFAMVCGVFVRNILEKPFVLQKMVQKQAGQLLQSEQRNRAIVDALPDILFVVDPEGKFIDYHFSQLLAPTLLPYEFLNRHIMDLLGEKDGRVALQHIKNTLDSGKLEIQEFQFQENHFEARYVKSSPSEVLVIVRSISDRVRQMHAIAEQNSQLKEIAWMQSHEMRAPLARIMAIIHWLQIDSQKDKKEQDEMLEHIVSSAYEMDKIIAGITDKTKGIEVNR